MKIKLEEPLYLNDIARAIGGCNLYAENPKIRYVTTDSRDCTVADLFFALPGEHTSGEEFAPAVNRAGAYAVTSRRIPGGCLLVADVAQALLALGAFRKKSLSHLKKTIAITGSVGKTTTKRMAAAILSVHGKVYMAPGNLNSRTGVPLSLLTAPADTEYLLLEFGMNHAGEIAELAGTYPPDIAVITNIGTAHIGNLGSRRAIADAKAEITMGTSCVLVPAEEPLLSNIPGRHTVTTVAESSEENVVNADFILRQKENNMFTFLADGIMADIFFPLHGEDAISALAFSLSLGTLCGMKSEELVAGVRRTGTELLRRTVRTVGGITLIDDSYNASPESVRAGLRNLQNTAGGKCVLLGDILELGRFTADIHRDIGASLPAYGVKKACFFGVYAPLYAEGARRGGMKTEDITVFTDTTRPELAARALADCLHPADTLFCKASHAVGLYRVVREFIRITEGNENV